MVTLTIKRESAEALLRSHGHDTEHTCAKAELNRVLQAQPDYGTGEKEECDRCKGKGSVFYLDENLGGIPAGFKDCPVCGGTGEKPQEFREPPEDLYREVAGLGEKPSCDTCGDLDQRRWTLYEAGPDRLEVRGPGLEEESVQVMLVATYEDALAPCPDCEKPVESGEGKTRWFEICWADHHFARTTAKNSDDAHAWAAGGRNSPVISVKEVANGGGDPLPTPSDLGERIDAIPRFTGAHIAAEERDGLYVEVAAVEAALTEATSGLERA